MPRAFDVTCAKNSIKLEGGKGEFSHTVSNRLQRPVRARTTVVPEGQTKREWLTVAEPTERDFAADGTQQFTVKVSTPPGTAPRSYSFKLLVSSVANPDEEFADGPSVSFEVIPPHTDPNGGGGLRWWWILAIVGGVLVIGIVGAVLYFKLRVGLHDPCDPTDKKCPESMVCTRVQGAADAGTAVNNVCLRKEGGDCESNQDCVTGRCDEHKRCGQPLPGASCNTDANCPASQRCMQIPQGPKACLLKPDVACAHDLDCSSLWCTETKKCARDDGKCVGPSECRAPFFLCNQGRCLKRNTEPCINAQECNSGFCNQTCQDPPPTCRPCPACPPHTVCVCGSCQSIFTRPIDIPFFHTPAVEIDRSRFERVRPH